MRYFDTGVLLTLYLQEPRAADAVCLVEASSYPPTITKLHELEMRAALRQKAGRGEITLGECAILIWQMEDDLDADVLVRAVVDWPKIFASAELLSALHGARTLCRSLDLLHVASALELGAVEFCSFDQRQSSMAVAAGLAVIA